MLWIEFCWAGARPSKFRVFGVEDRNPRDEVCIPQAILAAQYGSAIMPAYQEDRNPWDEVCIPKAILAAQHGSTSIPAYQEDPNPGDEVCIPKAILAAQ